MYIEFVLPTGAGGMAAAHASLLIRRSLEEWAEHYNVTFKTKPVKYTLRVFLETPDQYTLFALTWSDFRGNTYATSRWSLVEPMNPPKSID